MKSKDGGCSGVVLYTSRVVWVKVMVVLMKSSASKWSIEGSSWKKVKIFKVSEK